MQTLRKRLDRLEAKAHEHTRAGRVIAVRVGQQSEAEIEAFLAEQGVVVTPADLVVGLRNVYETKDGGEAFDAPELLNVTPMRKRSSSL